jgi:hypothetical protein
MDDEPFNFSIELPDNFPLDDLLVIARRLAGADLCVPGYIPPGAGLFDVGAFLYESQLERVATTLLPDRNVTSRWTQIVSGRQSKWQEQHRLCAALIAFAQCLDIQIEPSISFHELAHSRQNAAAHEELAWFRAADNFSPHTWMDIAFGRIDALHGPVQPMQTPNAPSVPLDQPLRRWRRNYIVAMKIAELELTDSAATQRVRRLFQWMVEDFSVSGSGALLALIYFAPRSPPREGLFKSLRSANRERALEGVRNAAWDLTHVSDFVRRALEHDYSQRVIFATLDDGLRQVARIGMGATEEIAEEDRLTCEFSPWWGEKDARELVRMLLAMYDAARTPEWAAQVQSAEFIARLTEDGEREILDWLSP